MIYLFILALFIGATAIAYQDFKSKRIHVYWLFFWGGLLITNGLLSIQNPLSMLTTIIFLVFIFFVLKIYVSVKAKRWEKLVDRYIGKADVIILLFLCFALSLLNYVAFLISVCFIGILYAIASSSRSKGKVRIPLAGIMTIAHFIVYSYAIVKPFDLLNNTFLLPISMI